VGESDARVGPEFPSESATESAASWRVSVPGAVHVASTVKLVPVAAETDSVHPGAVPDVVKSLAARPLIVFDDVNENCITRVLVCDAEEPHVMVGAVVSMETLAEDDVAAGPVFAFRSVTALMASVGVTVPSVVHVAVMVKVVPLDA
jgi:hypothetical protein